MEWGVGGEYGEGGGEWNGALVVMIGRLGIVVG